MAPDIQPSQPEETAAPTSPSRSLPGLLHPAWEDAFAEMERQYRLDLREQNSRGIAPLLELLTELVNRGDVLQRFCEAIEQSPVSADELTKVKLPPRVLEELDTLGVAEHEVIGPLARAIWLRDTIKQLRGFRRALRRPGFYAFVVDRVVAGLRREITTLGALVQEPEEIGQWYARKRLILVLDEESRAPRQLLDEVLDQCVKSIVGGAGPPADIDVRQAALWLRDTMRRHTGETHAGLVATLILHAGLIKVNCQPNPLVGTAERAGMECELVKQGKQERVCGRDPLRCGRATRMIEAHLERAQRGRATVRG